jgi:hypothetical protein
MTIEPPWPTVMATVTACKYEFGAGQALAFGIPTSKHFQITFNYWANGELHTGQFYSDVAIPQSHLFPISYNPSAPHEHSKSGSAFSTKDPLIVFGIAGSVVLSLLWLAILHGCNRHN